MANFEEIGLRVGKLVAEKNVAYADSFVRCGDIMKIIYPDGIRADQMTEALLVLRIVDKLCRVASRNSAFGESPFFDIAGYGICGVSLDE